MFDSIGRSSDDAEARRRYALSLLLTAGFYAGLAGVLAGVFTQQVPEVAQAQPVIEVTLYEPEPERMPGPPGLPAPKAQPQRPSEAPKEPAEPAEPPPEPTTAVPAVATPTPAPEPSQGPGGAGEPQGAGGGGTGGPGSGPGCDDADCDGTGTRVQRLTLTAKKRVEPVYPEAAKALGLGEQRCVAQVFVDEEGVPYQVDISGCPLAFHQATRQALLAWRFYPPRAGKQRVKGQMSIGITYRLEN